MRTIDQTLVDALIQYAPTPELEKQGFAEAQSHGATAAYNMLARNRVAYLADEVGMGKTYVALGVMGLLRHLDPRARVVVLAPRENIQKKWMKELRNFCRNNWTAVDNRVRSLQDGPGRPPAYCGSLQEVIRTLAQNANQDLFLRMHSFSVWSNKGDHRKRERARILDEIRWIQKSDIPVRSREEFLVRYGGAVNAIVPPIDLLVVDEAHNLKHGFSVTGSTRNLLLATSFGRPVEDWEMPPWYAPKVKNLLLLSATPFEYDYADLWRQLDLFGFGEARLADSCGQNRHSVRRLLDPDLDDDLKRELVQRFLLRRVSGLNIGGELYTKNMYRREWRQGGFDVHDAPLGEASPRERLVVGLMQSKVSEVLQNERFNNHFQIGMLSSFESFLESAGPPKRDKPDVAGLTDGESAAAFDGRQTEDRHEQEGIDRHPVAEVSRSYRDRFGQSLPHPKMDAAVRDLARSFETGEKALVFVRRVATMQELKARLDRRYDTWLKRKILSFVPELAHEFERLFQRYAAEQRGLASEAEELEEFDPDDVGTRRGVEDDAGGTDTFFSWFFRGQGPHNVLSGAAFQKNRLSSTSSAFALLFEDDLVSWLLGRPTDPLGRLAAVTGRERAALDTQLRIRAYARFRAQTEQKKGYPTLYVFEAYQGAALELLADSDSESADAAATILRHKFHLARDEHGGPPEGFPDAEAGIGVTTVPTELAGHADLERLLLPERMDRSFEERFLERQRRLELMSRIARLGAAYIDLYLLAIRSLGSLRMKTRGESEEPADDLARAFVKLLEAQRHEPGLHAYSELAGAAAAFDTLVKTNFAEVPGLRLSEVPTAFGRWLQSQSPVQTPRGAQVARLVRQFRMPGYPLVVITTNVLQEGEDLHTFCKKVVHYGITWTPSAMEQRTGRVDRIGGLVQRQWDGSPAAPNDAEWIQVHIPHLTETVERLQVERVLERMNRFLRLAHRNLGAADGGHRKLDVSREIVTVRRDVEQIRERLESAFEPDAMWRVGELGVTARNAVDVAALYAHLEAVWTEAKQDFEVEDEDLRDPRRLAATLRLGGGRRQPVELELRTQSAGDKTVLRCSSPVGNLALDTDEVLDKLYDLRLELGRTKLCAEYDAKHKHYAVTVESRMLFDVATTQASEVSLLVHATAADADRIEAEFFDEDTDPARWLAGRAKR